MLGVPNRVHGLSHTTRPSRIMGCTSHVHGFASQCSKYSAISFVSIGVMVASCGVKVASAMPPAEHAADGKRIRICILFPSVAAMPPAEHAASACCHSSALADLRMIHLSQRLRYLLDYFVLEFVR